MTLRLPVCAALVLALVACGARRPHAARRVSIAAAADLKFALDDLAPAFERAHPDIGLSISYGSSGNVYSQILNGAPFDLFLSADLEYPRQLAAQGFTVPGSDFVYAVGRLAVWVPNASPVDLSHGLAALVNVAHVAIANPNYAPYGRAAEAAMRSAGIYQTVGAKLVFGENVGQALQFAQSGAADAAVIAMSLAVAPPVASTGRFVEVPSSSFPAIEQGGAIVRRTADPDAAQAVRSFLMSDAAAPVFRRYGFALPGGR